MSDLPPGFDDVPEGFNDPPVISSTTMESAEAEVEAELLKKQKKSQKQQRRRAKNKKYMPPEHLRELMKEQGDLKGSKNKELRHLYVGSMKYMPLALYKFLENIPMPWEARRDVNVTYNVRGILSLVDDTPTVSEPLYQAQWGSVWTAMRRHKAEVKMAGSFIPRPFSASSAFLIFPDDVPPADYVNDIMRKKLPEPIRDDCIDADGDDKAIAEWFYVPEPILCPPNFIGEAGPLVADTERFHFRTNEVARPGGRLLPEWDAKRKGGRWFFSIDVISALYRAASSILNENKIDRNWYFLWDMKSFYTAKAMHVAIPRGPRFEPLHAVNEEELDEDWTEFNDLNTRIIREQRDASAKLTERQIQFPYLYSSEVRGVHIAPYHFPQHITIPVSADEAVPCFTVDPSLNTVVAVEKIFSEKDMKAALYAHRRDVVMGNKIYSSSTSTTTTLHNNNDNNNNNNNKPTFSTYADISDCFDGEALPGLCPLDSDDLVDLDAELFLPDDFAPFLSDLPLEHEPTTKAAVTMMTQALEPFASFRGGMSRRLDVNVVKRWAEDPVHKVPEEYPDKVRTSMTKLLKKKVANGLTKESLTMEEIRHGLTSSALRKEREAIPRTLDKLKGSDYFQQTTMDWLEVGLQLVRQGYTMLTQVLNLKGLSFLRVNYNFDTQPIGVLSTKERKKSRLGPSYLLLAELLKLVKYVVDLHVKYRTGAIDAFQLADGQHYIFTHLTKVTNLHKHKKRMERQAKEARDLKHLIYHRFNTGEVPKGPGTGFWAPSWRVCMGFLRGMVPLLHRFLNNLVSRMFEGRKNRVNAHRITKQRIEADTDLMIRDDFRREFMALLPEGVEGGARSRQLKLAEDHLSDAFRCWKRNARWNPETADAAAKDLINRYVARKADAYKQQAAFNRQRIKDADSVDKTFFKKNLGRLTRLELMAEQDRQRLYHTEGPYISQEESLAIYGMVADWLSVQQFEKIPFPTQTHRAGIELLTLTLNRLNDQHNVGNRLTQTQREEKKHIEDAFDHMHETLATIRDNLTTLRVFNPVEVDYMDHFSHLTPIYEVKPKEKIVDAFLDSYLWYEATERGLFPNWAKPADSEPVPVLVHKWCEGINRSPQIWETSHGEAVAMFQTTIGRQFYDKVDFKLFRMILELIMDKTLVDYIMPRLNATLQFRDMRHIHEFGLLRGFQFSSFLAQVWGLVIDLLILGSQRARQMVGLRRPYNDFLSFANEQHATCHPIRGYSRYNDQINILLRLTKEQADDLRRTYVAEQMEAGETTYRSVAGFSSNNKKCWPRESRMRLNLPDVNLARAIYSDISGRLPSSVVEMAWEDSFVSIYSAQNPNLLFDLGGFEIRIQPSTRVEGPVVETESTWRLRNPRTREVTARAYLQVTKRDVKKIQNKIRYALMTVGNSTFQAIAAKWNAVLGEIIPYYREAITATKGLQDIFVKGEKKMQQRVMMALNSKASIRFPAVIFYAPQEPSGGLGMLSVAQSLIPVGDIAFKSGLTNSDGIQIPNCLNYFTPWGSEIEEGKKAWEEYTMLKLKKRASGMRVSPDEIADLLDKGIPRIRTELMSDAQLFRFDKGFRARQEFMQYMAGRTRKDWWYHRSHDGQIYGSLGQYKKDMLDALGGMGNILEHSLFKATGLTSWEGMLWNNSNSFEQSKRDAKITKAQRGGLTNVPNRRFALWWSPTINRSNVFSNAALQLPTTGVVMHGKLVAIQKALIGVFDKDRWSRTHKGIVLDLAKTLRGERYQEKLATRDVSVAQNRPNKAYDFDSSAVDIVLHSTDKFEVSTGVSHLTDMAGEQYGKRHSSTFWIDVQLRWGNYDNHNIGLYARERYVTFTAKSDRAYNDAGIVIAIDLAYCCYSAYGYWIPGLKEEMARLVRAIHTSNAQLTELRDILKRALQLQTSNPTEANVTTSNIGEMFSDGIRTWIVDDSQTRFKTENGAVTILNPLTGDLFLNVIHKSVFKGQKRAKNLAREKAAECVATWLNTIDASERPNKIIVSRSTFRKSMSSMITDPNITVVTTDLNMVNSQLMFHSRLGAIRTNATANVSLRFRVYDDWPSTFVPRVCYTMLQTILRGYYLDINRTRELLEPQGVTRRPNHFWPTYERTGWQMVITHIEELILTNVCRRLGKKTTELTNDEKRSILMGKKFVNEEIQQDELEEMAKRRAAKGEATGADGKKKRRDSDGEEEEDDDTAIVGAAAVGDGSVSGGGLKETSSGNISSKKTRAKFEARVLKEFKPRDRALLATTMPDRAKQIYIDGDVTNTGLSELIYPDDLLQKFLRASDTHHASIAFVFGRKPFGNTLVSEVAFLVIPPQIGKVDSVSFPFVFPSAEEANGEEGGGSGGLMAADSGGDVHFLGILRTQTVDHCPNSRDLLSALRVADSLANNHAKAMEKYAEAVELFEHRRSLMAAAAGADGMNTMSGEERAEADGFDVEEQPPVPPRSFLLRTDSYDPTHSPFYMTIAAIGERDVIVNTNIITMAGYMWARDPKRGGGNAASDSSTYTTTTARATPILDDHITPSITRISPAISGYLLVPDHNLWNNEFIGQFWQDKDSSTAVYRLRVTENPVEYFSTRHRPNDVKRFAEKSCADHEVDMIEFENEFN